MIKFLIEGAPRRGTAGGAKEGSWLGRLGASGEEAYGHQKLYLSLIQREAMNTREVLEKCGWISERKILL